MTPPAQQLRSDCPINYALEIFGDRWTLIVLRDMIMKSRSRYRDLLDCEEGIATNVLADRLKRLERRGLVRKARDPSDQRQYIYRPTEAALSLVPMLVEMIVWGLRSNPQAIEAADFIRRFEDDRQGLVDSIVETARRAAQMS